MSVLYAVNSRSHVDSSATHPLDRRSLKKQISQLEKLADDLGLRQARGKGSITRYGESVKADTLKRSPSERSSSELSSSPPKNIDLDELVVCFFTHIYPKVPGKMPY